MNSTKYEITLPAFTGPLDLLLRLIEREELDITTIALAQVADQYLAYVRSLEAPEPRALAEFVSLAARLLVIKSRLLLPRPTRLERATDDEEEDDADALARQLREYRRYQQAAAWLRACYDDERQTFVRVAPLPMKLDLKPPLVKQSIAELLAAIQRRLQLRSTLDEPEVVSLAPRLTVHEVVEQIERRLEHQAWCSFDDLFGLSVTREDVIVTFWAVLELLKRRMIVLEQQALFGPISLGRAKLLP
ncbi:segregation and condensation protein A [Candidatus Chloroploca asiatica]|uniref:Segregation and condensation protein A n=1 Tax=Candidatus Chloroploca asiatica TaxID=1506545 RepID=A0A2H3LET8_9CHLR|nr:ScpA family protein [Candidatus Chloroploca asiatica]PDW01287.1 chromosome segregation protein ScpA [Candidatus Chloroploca asiatica]